MTVDDGHARVFSAVEQWNAECVGMYVCKWGTRFNVVQPVLEGVQSIFGSVDRGIAQGLALRLDHGSANCSERFQRELNSLGDCSQLQLCGGTPDKWGYRAVQQDAQGTGGLRQNVSEH